MRSPRRATAPAAGLVAAAALVFAAPQARAQRAGDPVPPAPWERRSPVGFTLGAGGLYQSARGSGAGRVADGGGFDAFGALHVASFGLGVGYQRSTHRLPGASTGRAIYDGVFVEPRVSVAPVRNFTPYLAGRVSFLRQRVPASAQFAAERRSLTALGAGVGTLVWLAPAVQLDLAAMYTDVRGSGRETAAGQFVGGTGAGAVLRAGVVVGFDRWGR